MKVKKILFIYGIYSIHAEKRMKIFLEDLRFEIAVVSRFDYSKVGIKTFKLDDYRDSPIHEKKPKIFRGFLYLIQLIKHFFYLKKVFKTFSPDVIFLQTLLYPAFLTFGMNKIPKIITFWNGDVTWWAKWDFTEKLFKYNIVKSGIRKAKLITVNSEHAKNCCEKYYHNYEKIIVLPYPGVDSKIFFPRSISQKEFILKKYGFYNEYLFFCPRGLADYLNNRQILNAFYKLKGNFNFKLIYLKANASIFELEKFFNLIHEFELLDNILIMDKLSPVEMAEIYSISNITISLSSNDSLPNCMLESMSCGTIVLMSDIVQIREWVVDSETGFTCEIGNVDMLVAKINFILKEKLIVEEVKKNAIMLVNERADLGKSKELIRNLVYYV